MSCDRRDQDLLLLAHGELPLWRIGRLQVHLRRCSLCRTRYARLVKVSSELSQALRNPEAAPWSPEKNRVKTRNRMVQGAGFLIVAVLCLLGMLLLAASQRPASPGGGKAQQNRPATDGCIPNLPNDRCR